MFVPVVRVAMLRGALRGRRYPSRGGRGSPTTTPLENLGRRTLVIIAQGPTRPVATRNAVRLVTIEVAGHSE